VPGVPGRGMGGDVPCGTAAAAVGGEPSAAPAAVAVTRKAAWPNATAGLLQPAGCCPPVLAGRRTWLGAVQQAAASWLLKAKDIGRQTTMTTGGWLHGHTSKVPASPAVSRGPAEGPAAAASVQPGRDAGCAGPAQHDRRLHKHTKGTGTTGRKENRLR
jgi:hypothetical protein